MINISYLEVPTEFQENKWEGSKLKDNMFFSAEPLYKNINIPF
jgi:hypothetical protein